MPRLNPDLRKKIILDAAVTLTRATGSVHAWTRQEVAEACVIGTSIETVKHYYPSIDDLRKEAGKQSGTEGCVNLFVKK